MTNRNVSNKLVNIRYIVKTIQQLMLKETKQFKCIKIYQLLQSSNVTNFTTKEKLIYIYIHKQMFNLELIP